MPGGPTGEAGAGRRVLRCLQRAQERCLLRGSPEQTRAGPLGPVLGWLGADPGLVGGGPGQFRFCQQRQGPG